MSQPSKIQYKGHVYVRAEATPKIIKIAGKEYVLAQMTTDQAAKAALDISTDIGALVLYLKEKGFGKDAANMEQIAGKFSHVADQLADMAAKA
jgi:hypothetical protein